MTVLLHDYYELEEQAARHLRAWKVWHLILYSLAAIFGILNYIALQSTMQLVDDNCVLYPRVLEFKTVLRPSETNVTNTLDDLIAFNDDLTTEGSIDAATNVTIAQNSVPKENATEKSVAKREIADETMDNSETIVEVTNVTIITGNNTHQLVMDTSRTLFALDSDCQFAEYMPVMSTVCALVWITLFTMCPGGGRARSGLQQPWRILTPALLFAIVLAALTGHSFSRTNGGLHAFCAEFVNVTNSTTCSSLDPLLERSWITTWGFGIRASGTRACAAATFAAWACASALLLARCLTAPDFVVKKTGAYLIKDPQGKLTSHLRKSGRRVQPSPQTSPCNQDNNSVASEPTCTTELATTAVEPVLDSAPSSLIVTPVRKSRPVDLIEMTYTPQERRQ